MKVLSRLCDAQKVQEVFLFSDSQVTADAVKRLFSKWDFSTNSQRRNKEVACQNDFYDLLADLEGEYLFRIFILHPWIELWDFLVRCL